jgi:hypothetical protein
VRYRKTLQPNEMEIANLTKLNQKLEEDLATARAAQDNGEVLAVELKETIGQLESQNRDLASDVQTKEEALRRAQEAANEIREQLKTTELRLEEVKVKNSELSEMAMSYQASLKEALCESGEKSTRILKLQSEVEESAAHVRNLKETIAKFELDSNLSKEDSTMLQAQLAEQEAKCLEAERNAKAAALELERKSLELQSAESYREAAESQTDALRTQLEEAQAKEVDLATQNAKLVAEKAKIEAESKRSLIQAVQANDYQLCVSICSRRPEELGVMRWLRDPNQKGKRVCTTALLEAIKLNHTDIAKLFLTSYSQHVDFEATDEDGQTALILAARYAKSNYPLVTLLCRYVKNPKAVRDGSVAPGGPDPEAVDKTGRNALHWAACNHTVDAPGKMCSYLRGFWVPVETKDKDGKIPYDIAKQESWADETQQDSVVRAVTLPKS